VDKSQNDRLDVVHFRHSIFNQPLFRSEKVRLSPMKVLDLSA